MSLSNLWDWTMTKPWKTWLAHSIIAFGLSFLFSPWTAAVFYMLREVEQTFLHLKSEGDFDGRDAVLDVFFPLLAASLYALLF